MKLGKPCEGKELPGAGRTVWNYFRKGRRPHPHKRERNVKFLPSPGSKGDYSSLAANPDRPASSSWEPPPPPTLFEQQARELRLVSRSLRLLEAAAASPTCAGSSR